MYSRTILENYVFDQQPNTLDPQTYLDVVRRGDYLVVEDGAFTLTETVKREGDSGCVEIEM